MTNITPHMTPLHQWWQSKLASGVLINDEWPDIAVKRLLWCDCVGALTRAGVTRRPSETEFWIALKKCTPEWKKFRKRIGGRPTWVTEVPSLAECRARWDRYTCAVPEPTLRTAIERGDLQAMHVDGRQWLISIRDADLDRWERRSA